MKEKLLKLMEEFKVRDLSYAIVKGNEIIASENLGECSKKEEPKFRIASISKPILCTALMTFWEEGRFNLEDDINKYLDFPVRNPKYEDKPITILSLMTHTSGLKGDGDDYFYDLLDNKEFIYMKDLICKEGRFFKDIIWSDNEPGKHFDYSNLGYTLLGGILEKISGMDMDKCCIERVFKPLGMDASFDVLNLKHLSEVCPACRYDEEKGIHYNTKDDYSIEKPVAVSGTSELGNCLRISPAGGVRTSLVDLSKFMRMHMHGGEFNGVRVLKKETVDLMHRAHWTGVSEGGFYKAKGLGFQITEEIYKGLKLVGHAGEAYGIRCGMYFNEKQDFGIIILENGGIDKKVNKNEFTEVEKGIYNIILSR